MTSANIRMPAEVYARLKEQARALGRSLDELAVEILDRESRRWAAQRALATARTVREDVRKRFGDLPDSTPELRRLREDRADDA